MEPTFKKHQLKMNLRKALERNEFQLYYQPKFDLVSGEIKGVEALIRWNHPKRGVVFPAEFISLAEKTGLIIPIGEWALRTACLQIRAWQEAGLPMIGMSVNLSVSQLIQPNFVESVKSILNNAELEPKYLELEITESMMMDDCHALSTLKRLKHIGIQISLDDFGTGYSTFYYLREFPISKIKIDQSFLRNCPSDVYGSTIVKTIIRMAHQLKLEVTAEGLETKEHLIFLQQNLCNEGQGYFFSKPVPPEEFVRNFYKMQQVVNQHGISRGINGKEWMPGDLQSTHQELLDTVKQQQGMIFKFREVNGKFIHTLCEGELLYQMNLTPEKFIGRELQDFLQEGPAKKKLQFYRRAWAGEENVMYEGMCNGIYYIASLRPIRRGGQVVEVIGSCVDITKRKKIEEKLRENQSKFRLITENIQDLIRVFDTHGIIEYASPSHELVLGFQPEVYEGNLFFEMVHPDDLHYIRKQYVYTISSKKPCQIEYRYKHVYRDWVYIEEQWTPVLNKNDEVEHLVGVARDISGRKKTEEYIRKSEKLSIVGQLAAGVAHEIRNPLTSIKGFIQLLQKEVDAPFYTDTILSEIHRLEEVVEDFLILTKPQIFRMDAADLKILLEQVVALFDKQAVFKNVRIVQEYNSEFPLIYCDGDQMKQVFIHLLQNAIEAMPNGGIIKVQLLWNDTEHVKVRFIDQGSGISEERIKKIGEPYYCTKEKGIGLGLMISQKIVQEHGGNIRINSVLNQGTTVDVILPIKHAYILEN